MSIVKSFGARELDRAAIETVRSARYPAAPNALDAAQYHFNLPLVLSKNEKKLMFVTRVSTPEVGRNADQRGLSGIPLLLCRRKSITVQPSNADPR